MVFKATAVEKSAMDAELGAKYERNDGEESLSNDSDSVRHDRGNWGRKLDFLLSCVGYAVGLGNLWRFPYLCMRNGGGAFLIPYFTFLLLCGIPLFFMELSLGQYASLSPISIWKIAPLFKGVGYGMVLVSGIVCLYYNLILAWSLYYMGMSFTTRQLPWATCNNPWNTKFCVQRSGLSDIDVNATNGNQTAMSALGTTIATYIREQQANDSVSGLVNATVTKTNTPAEEFWHYNVLEISSGIDNMNGFRWELLICLIVAWVIVFLCMCKGIKTSGKVVYVTAVAPYVMLLVFLVRGVTLPGAMTGIRYYLTPDFQRLLDFQVWCEACAQIFYSLGPAYGSLITMSSYNKFNSDCYKDALIIPCINCATSFIAGFAIFSIIGFMSEQANVPVGDVITSGPGLAFVVYPEALTQLPISQFWSVIFFLMLLILGLDTQFGMFEALTSGFIDEFPKHLAKRKTLFTAFMCVVQFTIGLPLVCRGGVYLFQVMDWYSATFSLITIGFTECFVIAWVYGADKFYANIEEMIGYRPCVWWKICWKFITPLLLFTVLLVTIIRFNNVTYGDYTYPTWACGVGWMFAMVSLCPIPILMVKGMYEAEGTFIERFKGLIRPAADWGPAFCNKVVIPADETKMLNISDPPPEKDANESAVDKDDTDEPLVNRDTKETSARKSQHSIEESATVRL